MTEPQTDPVTDPPEPVTDPPEPDPQTDPPEPDGDPETFPLEYVQELRTEAADRRAEAREAREALDPLREALWAARVAASGRLADPSDLALPEDADPLDAEAVTAAVDDLLTRKPHLASRRPGGDVGQGASGGGEAVDLASILRARA